MDREQIITYLNMFYDYRITIDSYNAEISNNFGRSYAIIQSDIKQVNKKIEELINLMDNEINT